MLKNLSIVTIEEESSTGKGKRMESECIAVTHQQIAIMLEQLQQRKPIPYLKLTIIVST